MKSLRILDDGCQPGPATVASIQVMPACDRPRRAEQHSHRPDLGVHLILVEREQG